jgi:hypothetical protein
MSAACIAAPAVVGAPHAAAAANPSVTHSAVTLTADATVFDLVPAAARLVDLDVNGLNTADIGTLVDLLTFPYHNVYAVGSAVGRAANAGVQVLGLPLSLAFFLATNASDTTIQNYLNSVQTNVNGALPGIVAAIQSEIAYDVALFNEVFGGGSASAVSQLAATDAAPTAGVTASGADIGRLVDLLTFPYHNVYAVGSAVGRAANAGVQVLGLPLSLAFFLATNASDTTIQNYLNSVQTNVNGALPGIVAAIQSEIEYNRELFNDFFGGATAEATGAAARLAVEPAAPTDGVTASAAVAAAGVDLDTLVDLATFPYHNVYAVGSAFGRAANAGVQVAGLPLSLAYYLATNASDETIQNYLASVQKNVNGALPGIVDTIQSEIDYDRDLFAKVFGLSATKSTVSESKKATAVDSDKADTGALTDDDKPDVAVDQNDESGLPDTAPAGTPQTKHSTQHGFDLAAAVKAVGGSLAGIGKHARGGKSGDEKADAPTSGAADNDDTKQGDTKTDDTKQGDTKTDDTKQGDTKTDDTKTDDAGPGHGKTDDGGSGQTGGRHRLAG